MKCVRGSSGLCLRPNDNAIFTIVLYRATNATAAYQRIECVSRDDDEAHSSDKKYVTTAAATCDLRMRRYRTGLGFQKEMTHPLDDV